MIFAAGRGARLRPLTDTRPKALVNVEGRPLVEWVIARLTRHGFTDLVINAHHFADRIAAFAERYQAGHPDVSITVSHEPELLDTGGGLWNAARFFDDGEPFLVHNVDVLSDLDLNGLMAAHREADALATLAVLHRHTNRYLLFDRDDRLCGKKRLEPEETCVVRRVDGPATALSFMGIQAVSPAIFDRYTAAPPFSIIDAYLALAAEGEAIRAYRGAPARWMDMGRPEHLERAPRLFGQAYFNGLREEMG